MKHALPLKSMAPSAVVIVPELVARGQKACLIVPHGAFGSVPKVELPSFPTWKAGAVLVTERLTTEA